MATVDDRSPLDDKRDELQRAIDEQENIKAENAEKRFDEVTRSRFNKLEDEIEDLEAFIAEKEKVEKIIQRHAASGGDGALERVSFQTARPGATKSEDIYDLSTIERSWDNPEGEERQYRDRGLKAIERAKFPHPKAQKESEDVQGHLERLIGDGEDGGRRGAAVARHLLATGSPEYRRAFTRSLSGAPLNEHDQSLIYRAMSLSGASGGVAVPFVLDPTLIPTSNGAVNPYRAISNVSSITVDEWRGVTSAGITAAFQAEAAATTDQSPTLASASVSTEMARINIPYSIEIGMDWGSFASDMASEMQDAKDVLEATKFAVGSGTNEPFGVVTGATTVFTASDTDSIISADLYGVFGALPPRFRNGAAWTFNNAILAKVRQIDTTGGSDMLVPNLQLRSAAQVTNFQDARAGVDLFGLPVYEASGQASAVTTGQLIGVVGDFGRYYKIVDRIGLTVVDAGYAQDATTGMPTGQKFLLGYWRVGAKVLHANAFRTLKLA